MSSPLTRDQVDKLKKTWAHERGKNDLFIPGTEPFRDELERFKRAKENEWKLEANMQRYLMEPIFLQQNDERDRGQSIQRVRIEHGWLYTRTVWSPEGLHGSMIFIEDQGTIGTMRVDRTTADDIEVF